MGPGSSALTLTGVGFTEADKLALVPDNVFNTTVVVDRSCSASFAGDGYGDRFTDGQEKFVRAPAGRTP